MSTSKTVLLTSFREIKSMTDRINVPNTIVERANDLFKQVHDGRKLKGRSKHAIASACLYIACRQEGVPRTFKDICTVSNAKKPKEIEQCFKFILKTLETSVDIIKTGDFMSRFCSNLGLPKLVQRTVIHIARKAVELDLVTNRSLLYMAAAAICMGSQALDHKVCLMEVCNIAGIDNPVGVRHSYKLLYPHAVELFPANLRFCTLKELLPEM